MASTVGIGRLVLAVSAINASLTGALLYNNNKKLERNHEEAEARMDELEGTLRGHIGLIEESLERIECNQHGGRGEKQSESGMGAKAEEIYTSRGGKNGNA